ncbi:MAG: hypothetical protein NTY07_00255 [Bacteroidia bacterium]|nr:hypothetical protein [Bacteroidia bacterium]
MYLFIKRFIFQIFVPTRLKKYKDLRRHQTQINISDEKKAFISLNKDKWKDSYKNTTNKNFVLVEGFLASYGPNYLLRTGIIAKTIEEELQLTPLILVQNYLEKENEIIALYKSFDIDFFESEKNFQPYFYKRFCNFFIALKLYISIIKPEDLLKLEHNGIFFGDLLYDTILKNSPGVITINKITSKEFIYIFEALQLIETYLNLLKKKPVNLYISTHSQYLTYGLLLRVCSSKYIPVIESTDIQLWLHQKQENEDIISNSKYHEYLQKQIKLLLENKNISISTTETEKVLNDRFIGNFDQSDVRLAYKNKKIYNCGDLCEALNINNNYPFVYIFAHVFADAPQGLSNRMLFKDYYTWLEETIKEACSIKGINWIVKPHPSNKLYNESGLVDEIVKKQNSNCVHLCPDDLSPVSVIETASAIVTAQGTVGIEYTCMGIPVVLASNPFYSGFGFTIEPGSIAEYKVALRDILKYPKLTEDQKVQAKKVFAAFMLMQQSDTSLIDTNVLLAVWGGSGQPPSSDRAFDLVNQKLTGIDLKNYSLYNETKKLIKNIRPYK